MWGVVGRGGWDNKTHPYPHPTNPIPTYTPTITKTTFF